MAEDDTPVGLVEIAERLGVKPKTVQMWRYRKLLPEPAGTVSGAPAWPWHVIRRWAIETGRLDRPSGRNQAGMTSQKNRSSSSELSPLDGGGV
jgi:hypothetical protein